MKHTSPQALGLLATTLLGIGWGCSDIPPVDTTTQEATVHGVITINGKAVTSGRVVFDAANIKRKVEPRKAEIGKDGSYSIKTLVGENVVKLEANQVTKANLEAQFISTKVEPGDNTFDIKLPLP
jgi:hypothetical protein